MGSFELTDNAKRIIDSPLAWCLIVDAIDWFPISATINIFGIGAGDLVIDLLQLLVIHYAFKNPLEVIGQYLELTTSILPGIGGGIDMIPSATITYILDSLNIIDTMKIAREIKSITSSGKT